MMLIDFIDLLDALPASFSNFRIAVERDGNTYFAVNIEIDAKKRVITIIDSSEVMVDDTIFDATDRAEPCTRNLEYPTDDDLNLELG